MTVTLQPAISTHERLIRARAAAPLLAQFSSSEKSNLLMRMADALEASSSKIIAANAEDLQNPQLPEAMRDRLLLNVQRIADIARAVREIADLPDPIGEVIEERHRPNGLLILKVRVPLGVVGIIYESRPNVTVDVAALCWKTGNAVVLRGGKEAAHSNRQIVEILNHLAGVPPGAIELLDSSTRESAQELMQARGFVDVLIPRGGAELIAHVARHAAVPVIETGAGNCHIFVDESADLDMADRIVVNAKTQRPSVCNATEKLLVHESIAADYIPRIVEKLTAAGVEIRGDQPSCRFGGSAVHPATEEDWNTEYLRLCIAIRVVANTDSAIEHINRYSTKNSEAIITRDAANARKFLRLVDSAAVYWNASTRFTDGGEFGFGAEMGISTQKLHCRGPFALAELTSSKYEITGTGQVRP